LRSIDFYNLLSLIILYLRGLEDNEVNRIFVWWIIYQCRMFICPRKRYLYCVNHCVSMGKFLNDIFGGQTGDKISHTKRKKNNKTLSENDTEMWGTQFVPRYCFVCPSLSLGREVRFSIISETLKVITCT